MRLDRAMHSVDGQEALITGMCRVDSQIFLCRLHYFIQIIVLAACLQKLLALHARICFRVAMPSIVPVHFPNQISEDRPLTPIKNPRIYATQVLAKARSNLVRQFLFTTATSNLEFERFTEHKPYADSCSFKLLQHL